MGSSLSFPALRLGVIRVADLQIPAVRITGYPSHGRCSTATRNGIMIRNAWAEIQRARIDGNSKDKLSRPRTHGPSPPLSCESAPSIRVTPRSESPLDPSHSSIRVTPRSESTLDPSHPSIRVTPRSESPLDPSHPSIRVTPRSDSESQKRPTLRCCCSRRTRFPRCAQRSEVAHPSLSDSDDRTVR